MNTMPSISVVFSVADWVAMVGTLVSLGGLIVSIISLVKVGRVDNAVKAVEQTTKTRINNSINLTFIVETIYLIKLLQESIGHNERTMAAYFMSELHLKLSEISSKRDLMEAARQDFKGNIDSFAVILVEFKNSSVQGLNSHKQKEIDKTLNSIIENLKLIERKVKE